MQHEPIGYIDCNCKQAEFAHGANIDKEPDYSERKDIRQGSKQNLEPTTAQTKSNSFWNRIMEWHREHSFRLLVSGTSSSVDIKRHTRVDIFSTPTITITIGNTQAGTEEGKLDQPHPFHPIRARTESDMIAEQQSWTIPVIARPTFECTRVAKLT